MTLSRVRVWKLRPKGLRGVREHEVCNNGHSVVHTDTVFVTTVVVGPGSLNQRSPENPGKSGHEVRNPDTGEVPATRNLWQRSQGPLCWCSIWVALLWGNRYWRVTFFFSDIFGNNNHVYRCRNRQFLGTPKTTVVVVDYSKCLWYWWRKSSLGLVDMGSICHGSEYGHPFLKGHILVRYFNRSPLYMYVITFHCSWYLLVP